MSFLRLELDCNSCHIEKLISNETQLEGEAFLGSDKSSSERIDDIFVKILTTRDAEKHASFLGTLKHMENIREKIKTILGEYLLPPQ